MGGYVFSKDCSFYILQRKIFFLTCFYFVSNKIIKESDMLVFMTIEKMSQLISQLGASNFIFYRRLASSHLARL